MSIEVDVTVTEREQEKLNQGRLMRAESDIILPLLAAKERVTIGKIVSAFRSGPTYEQIMSLAAELTTIHDMKAEVGRKIKEAEAIERRMFEPGKQN